MPDIAFWNKCDNRCVMCTNMASFSASATEQYRLKGQVLKMEKYLKSGGVYAKNAGDPGFLTLTGGEPAIHPDFFQLLSYFRRRLPGVPITLLSNGRRFARRAFCSRFLKIAGAPFCVAVPLHGPGAALHDAITGVPGSFAQTVAGLSNLFALRDGQQVEVRLVLHGLNIAELRRTLEFLLKEFPGTAAYRVAAIHYEIEGMSRRNRRALELTLSDSAAAVNACADLIREFPAFRLYHYPLCLLTKGLRPLSLVTLPADQRVYPRSCGRCALKKGCAGLMSAYYAGYGAAELRPSGRRA